MDHTAYRKHLRYTRDEAKAVAYVEMAEAFEVFLLAQDGSSLGEATPGHFASFDRLQDQSPVATHWRCRYLSTLFQFLENEAVVDAAFARSARSPMPALLEKFRSAPLAHRRALEKVGIVNNIQLLAVCRTKADRDVLAAKADIPRRGLRLLLKLSDLRRLVGLSRLLNLMEAGIDTLDKVAALEQKTLFARVQKKNPTKKLDPGGYRDLPRRAALTPRMLEYF